MELQYLDFDFSSDAHGQGSFDAMASATPAQLALLQAEVVRVLAWAERQFGAPAAPDEGGTWDYALHGVREVATALDVNWRPGAPQLEVRPGEAEPPRVTLTLTLTGTEPFCAAFREAFAVA